MYMLHIFYQVHTVYTYIHEASHTYINYACIVLVCMSTYEYIHMYMCMYHIHDSCMYVYHTYMYDVCTTCMYHVCEGHVMYVNARIYSRWELFKTRRVILETPIL